MAKKQQKIINAFPVELNDETLFNWFNSELEVLPKSEANILNIIINNLADFVVFPREGRLFFLGLVRQAPRSGLISYPPGTIFSKLNPKGKMEIMTNGPAVVAFENAGGSIPLKGNGNSWSIHHLYAKDFPYIGTTRTLHAIKDGAHFTHTAGMVAVHPLADAAAHEYACFSWFLRAKAFLLFGYNPDNVF